MQYNAPTPGRTSEHQLNGPVTDRGVTDQVTTGQVTTGQDTSGPAPSNGRRARRVRRRTSLLFALALVVVGGAACTPEQIAFVAAVSQPYEHVLDGDQLYRLRVCESGDNYEAVDRSGSFRGAYQFNRGTWDSVASRHFEWLVGVDPAEAEPWWQDVMARALWSERGRQPWPVCGRRI